MLEDLKSGLKLLHYFRKNPPTRESREVINLLINETNKLLVPKLKAEREAKGESEPEAQAMGMQIADMTAKTEIKGNQSIIGGIDVVYTDEPMEDETFTINLGE